MTDEIMIDETELYDLDVPRIDLVGRPANRRTWALAKGDTEDIGGVSMAEVEKVVVQPAADTAPVEAVDKAVEAVTKENQVLKDQLIALQKAFRVKELEPLCKDVDVEVEKAWQLEQLDKGLADYFMGKLDVATKRITALMKEIGKDNAPEQEDELMAEAGKIAKSENIPLADAIVKAGNARPDLAAQYVKRQRARAE